MIFEIFIVSKNFFILKDPCENVVCGNDQSCVAGECVCNKTGYEKIPVDGECVDIDECSNDPCEYDEKCENVPGSYECVQSTVFMRAATSATTQAGCGEGFESDDYGECFDIDECQNNNGGCPAMCINLYGSFMCYNDFDKEQPLCHHFTIVDPSIDPYGYKCGCYEGYDLCEDGFTCTCTGNEYVPKPDNSIVCDRCQFSYRS